MLWSPKHSVLPRITIVTPSYNQAQYLGQTIESVLNQGYPNLEHIVIDGGSTDGSVEIIKRYEGHLAYWVSEKDSGQAKAINKGLAKATGHLFNWINSDDILFPGALWRISDAYVRNPGAGLYVGYNARGDSAGRITRISVPPLRPSMSPSNWVMCICQQSTFVATEILKKIGGVREDLHYIMDTELYYRLFAAGCQYVRVESLVGLIREHADAKGVVQKDHWLPELERMLEEYRISRTRMRLAQWRLRFCRVLDGSYLRSYLLLRSLKRLPAWPRRGTA